MNISDLLILRCPDPRKWYADKIGQHLPLVRVDADCYVSVADDGFSNVISKTDATFIFKEVIE